MLFGLFVVFILVVDIGLVVVVFFFVVVFVDSFVVVYGFVCKDYLFLGGVFVVCLIF